MFGRRRHRAPVNVAPPAPVEVPLPAVQLSEEQLFDVVRQRLEDFMGASGEWTLVRRADADTDEFFQDMAAFSLARDVTASILGTSTSTAQASPVAENVPSGLAEFGASVLDAEPFDAPDFDSLVTRPIADQVTFELNAIAVWADPKRHDPSHVDASLVNPPAPADSRPIAHAS
ncbi:hypothetical protein L1277_000547 [Okibacterium sp. HSC-33S16]|uniref:hypothetical protein n=1 Tax=Okibacterium sp. HSC-33S16 TaxID=2910965 RepID=UPI00209DB376|nr:hypothetical protein [Okibacterium sp. HSC-33S16]MCP2030483.1 hypothetical protein [Okibacterium sp. HSC-33S16]